MRILQVNNMGSRHGFDHAAANQFRALLAARPDCRLWLVRNTPLSSMPEIPVLTMPRWVRALPSLLRSLFRLGQALGAIFRHRIDFVHGVHLWPHGLVAWVSAWLTRRPRAITIVAGSREIHLLGRGMERLALFCLRRCDAVVVTGERTRDHLLARGIPSSRLHVIPNLTDVQVFRPDPQATKRYDIVFTGRLFPIKNVPTLLRAVARLKGRWPLLQVAIGGQGPERSPLEALARQLDLAGQVEFLGYMDDVAATLNAARIYVLTSRSEGFPISVLEAMSCGLPCVVSDVGDMRDVVRDGENGFLIADCDDDGAFAEALEKILGDPALEERLARGALRVRETHSFAAAGRLWNSILAPLATGKDRI